MKTYKRVFAEIDLDALRFNMEEMKRILPEGIQMAGVVKTDGYGHGAVPCAKEIADFVSFYCVAAEEEALSLRMHGIEKPVLILGPVPGDAYKELILKGVRPAVFTLKQAEAFQRDAAEAGIIAPLHIAVDTGMHRIGLKPDESGVSLVKEIASLPNVKIEGLFTHLYRADETDLGCAKEQVECFDRFRLALKSEGIIPEICHVSNSAGIMENLGSRFDMVRAGITMYGIYPSDEVDRTKLPLRPLMSIRSTVTYVKTIVPGDEISYGGTFRAEKEMRVATIPTGYGDGYPRLLSSRGEVLIAGKRARILGRVCMDQFMVDVTEIPEAEAGMQATLLGKDGEDEITVEELSAICGRFPYEFVCDIGKRVPRVYLRGGQVVGTKDWFDDRYTDFL